MTKYIEFNEDNILIARYDDAISDTIPNGAVEVSDSQFRETIDKNDQVWTRDPNSGAIDHHEYVPTDQEKRDDARVQRDNRLEDLDDVVSNPLRWDAMTSDRKQACSEYRQALLDVPQQDGFPDNVNWPQAPRQM
jgi:hypothetical protein